MKDRTLTERKKMIDPSYKDLSIRQQTQLLSINRSSLYYKAKEETDHNLKLMSLIDKIHLKYPTYGVLRMQEELKDRGHIVNHKRVRRLMRLMRINVIYPKLNLSKLGERKYIHPYLLKDLDITRADQAWAIDITYIPMHKGFMYLTGVIDIYSRYLVGWRLSNTLDKEVQVDLIKDCISKNGKPEIINSDQGSQFTSELWVNTLKENEIKISMDGKGRALDNIYIERFWRTIKQDYVYLNPANDGLELYRGIGDYIKTYNNRKHQSIEQRPVEKYKEAA